ncbi:DNA adenine methylase [Dyadobacter psychrotolerans]|uniref:DNA adenine methylase n=2 Tax=Dyadobacter psychrotolerans TaxID=2541721 RepID=A0A4R5D9H3_9BACT|nr:DNA adenine methylase [Dyadobacter psychrotolerans]
MNKQLNLFGAELELDEPKNKVVNVASVPQRSPFRYPGGKTWLIPTVRKWLKQDKKPIPLMIEPFAGGGIVSLTAAFENLAEKVIMTELDPEISAVWETIFSDDNQWLADKILHFNLSIETAKAALEIDIKQVRDIGFNTILKNRICHGGIITKGAGFLKNGENGKGIASRWYAKTLYDRITAIQQIIKKVEYKSYDAFQILEDYRDCSDCYFFIDPPYTKAGKRLYTFYDLDHAKLFEYVAKVKGRFMLTYDDTEEIRGLADKFGLRYTTIPMKTTHHLEKNEIIISDNLEW